MKAPNIESIPVQPVEVLVVQWKAPPERVWTEEELVVPAIYATGRPDTARGSGMHAFSEAPNG